MPSNEPARENERNTKRVTQALELKFIPVIFFFPFMAYRTFAVLISILVSAFEIAKQLFDIALIQAGVYGARPAFSESILKIVHRF